MEDEIKALKEQEQAAAASPPPPPPVTAPPRPNSSKHNHRPHRRHRPSFFGPLLLIGLGVYFLLRNMGYAIELNWWAVWQAWPLFLILIGLKIIAEQAESGLLRGLANLTRLGGFALLAGLLFFGHQLPFVRDYLPQPQTAEISVPLDGRETATVKLEFGTAPVRLYALDDSPNILAGNISYVGHNSSVHVTSPPQEKIALEVKGNMGLGSLTLEPWELGLHPQPALNLELDLGTGTAELDLRQLTLRQLDIDGGTGATTLYLPDGTYTAEYDGGTGAIAIYLPSSGVQSLRIEAGTGAVTFYLPPQIHAEFRVAQRTGGFSPSAALVAGNGSRQGGTAVWQTAGFDSNSADRIEIFIERGTGGVTVLPQSGR